MLTKNVEEAIAAAQWRGRGANTPNEDWRRFIEIVRDTDMEIYRRSLKNDPEYEKRTEQRMAFLHKRRDMKEHFIRDHEEELTVQR